MKFLYIFVLCLISGIISAKEVTFQVNLQPPTQYANGKPFTSRDLNKYEFYYTFDDQTPDIDEWEPVYSIENETGNLYNMGNFNFKIDLEPREEPYVVNVYARTVDVFGVQSDLSNPVTKTFTIKSNVKPNLIVDLDFNVTCSPDCEVKIIRNNTLD